MKGQLLHQAEIQTVKQNITQSMTTFREELCGLQSKLNSNITALDKRINQASNIHDASLTSMNDIIESVIFNQTYFNNIAKQKSKNLEDITCELAKNQTNFYNQLASFNESASIELRSVVEELLMLQSQTKFDYTILNQTVSEMYSNLIFEMEDEFGYLNESLNKEISHFSKSFNAQTTQKLSCLNRTIQIQLDDTIVSVGNRLMNMNASVSDKIYNFTEVMREIAAQKSKDLEDFTFAISENQTNIFKLVSSLNESATTGTESIRKQLHALQSETQFDNLILNQTISEMYSNLSFEIDNVFGYLNESLKNEISHFNESFNAKINQKLSSLNQTIQIQLEDTMVSVGDRLMNMNATVSDIVYRFTTFENISNFRNNRYMDDIISITEEVHKIDNQSATLNETVQGHLGLFENEFTQIRFEVQRLNQQSKNETEILQSELRIFTAVINEQLMTLSGISTENYSALNMSFSQRLGNLPSEFKKLLDNKVDALNKTASYNFLTLANHTKQLGQVLTTGDSKTLVLILSILYFCIICSLDVDGIGTFFQVSKNIM